MSGPANPTFTTVKGNTLVTVTAVPVVPQAGQPITFTAVISNSGNGTGLYSFSGNVTFYDNGKIIATGAGGPNQASTSRNSLWRSQPQHRRGLHRRQQLERQHFDGCHRQSDTTAIHDSLTSNVSTALAGVNLVFTATVFTTVANTVGPTGTIAFYDTFNGSITKIGTGTLTPNGPNQSIANFSTTGLLAGTHSVYAIYSGDTDFTTVTSATLPISLTDYTVTMSADSYAHSWAKGPGCHPGGGHWRVSVEPSASAALHLLRPRPVALTARLR